MLRNHQALCHISQMPLNDETVAGSMCVVRGGWHQCRRALEYHTGGYEDPHLTLDSTGVAGHDLSRSGIATARQFKGRWSDICSAGIYAERGNSCALVTPLFMPLYTLHLERSCLSTTRGGNVVQRELLHLDNDRRKMSWGWGRGALCGRRHVHANVGARK
jgi:hypothetical protein